MPIVTVLMPVYNSERFLKKSIESILDQTLTDFEFLIIDDGSTDTSAEIVRSYNDPRIRFIQNEKNIGITATLNKGIELAACELIARMDADDYSYPLRLQKQYEFFEKNPDCALLSTWTRHFNYKKNICSFHKHKSEHYYYGLIFNCWIYHPSVMYKRSVVMDVGMYSQPYSEDFNLWGKISRKYKIYNLPEVLVDYYPTHTSLTTVLEQEYEDAHNETIRSNVAFYTGNDFKLSDEEVQFLRGRTGPIASKKDKKFIINAFKKFDYITSCIEKVDNINKTSNRVIREPAFFKKKQLINGLCAHLSNKEIALLLCELHCWKLLFIKVRLTCVKEFKRLAIPLKNALLPLLQYFRNERHFY